MLFLEEALLTRTNVETAFLHGLEMSTATLAVTVVLEFFSWETAVAAYKKDKELYLQAVALNFLNHWAYGIPVYLISELFFIRRTLEHESLASTWVVALQVLGVLLIHSVCYYQAHKTFHSCPGYYQYHKFHHRFNTYVSPVAANAVGFVEYLFAYVLPFAVAGAVVRPYYQSIRVAIYIVSMTNLSIHTPKIEAWSEQHMPSFWVSTHDHLEHHRKLNVHYAAPTFNLDWAVSLMDKKKDDDAVSTGDNSSSH